MNRVNPPETDLRYPIGQFEPPEPVTSEHVQAWIDDIAALPGDLRRTVAVLSDSQLDTRYRSGGWTARQVVHHLPDSHINSYVRFKLALTEDRPKIKPYNEKGWAALSDSRGPVDQSLDLLEALHRRWVNLLRGLSWEELQREFLHPESGPSQLALMVGTYAWHGRHHLAHIDQLVLRRGWI